MNAYNQTEIMNGLPPSLNGMKIQILVNTELKPGDYFLHHKLLFGNQRKTTWFKVVEVYESYDVSKKYRKCKPKLLATDFYTSIKVENISLERMDELDEIVAQHKIAA